MKNIILFILVNLLLVASCTGIKTLSKGLENESFLEFIGNPNDYNQGLSITIDEKIYFKAVANKPVKYQNPAPRGKLYAISPGKHIISVSYNNNVIVRKQIFISSQETKQIILPWKNFF